jgi:hypothetical protein
VAAIDRAKKRLTLKQTGASVLVSIDDKTVCRRVPPGETTLEKAVVIAFEDIIVGDRVIARGALDESGKVMHAGAIIVVSKEEIEKKRERDRAEWLRRGITGTIVELKPETTQIIVLTRLGADTKRVTINTIENVRFRRYAPGSVKFADAKLSSFADLKVNDQLRALGEKSADGSRFVAEEVVSGTFRTASGTITDINVANGEIKINDLQTRQPLIIDVNRDAVLRRFTPELVELLKQSALGAAKKGSSEERKTSAGSSTGASPAQSESDLQDRIEQLPALTLADLKTGDAVLVASTTGSSPNRVTAIIVAVGVEDFLKWQAQTANVPQFTFGLGLPSGSPTN